MRIVYDDAKLNELVISVDLFMTRLDVKKVVEYECGMERVQMHKLKNQLNLSLERSRMNIGNKVTHAHGIGNNCQYPVYYHPEGGDEIQVCAYINLNTGMYGEGFLSCEDYNGNRIGTVYEIRNYGVKRR